MIPGTKEALRAVIMCVARHDGVWLKNYADSKEDFESLQDMSEQEAQELVAKQALPDDFSELQPLLKETSFAEFRQEVYNVLRLSVPRTPADIVKDRSISRGKQNEATIETLNFYTSLLKMLAVYPSDLALREAQKLYSKSMGAEGILVQDISGPIVVDRDAFDKIAGALKKAQAVHVGSPLMEKVMQAYGEVQSKWQQKVAEPDGPPTPYAGRH